MTVDAEAAGAEPQFTVPCVIGSVTGFVLFTIGGTWLGLSAGFDFAGAFGFALFAAAWGGIGFGAMAGAVYAVSRPAVHNDAAPPVDESAGVPSTPHTTKAA